MVEIDQAKIKELQVQIEPKIQEAIKVNQNFLRAFNFRNKLFESRLDTINKIKDSIEIQIVKVKSGEITWEDFNRLFSSFIPADANSKLSIYNKDERKFMNILESAKAPTLSMLKTAKDIKIKPQLSREINKVLEEKYGINIAVLQRISKIYLDFVNNFYKNYKEIMLRLELESTFLSQQDSSSFYDYLQYFGREFGIQFKINKKLNDLKDVPSSIKLEAANLTAYSVFLALSSFGVGINVVGEEFAKIHSQSHSPLLVILSIVAVISNTYITVLSFYNQFGDFPTALL